MLRGLPRVTSREAAEEGSLPLVPKEGVTKSPRLFAENKNTGLAREADFLHLPVLADQQGVVRGLGAAVFPAAFGFGNDVFALLDGGFRAFDLQTVFTGFQFGLAELCVLGDVDCLGKRLRECRYRQGDSGEQSDTAEEQFGFHACQLPFVQDRVSRTAGCRWLDGVDTRAAGEYSRPEDTSSSWTIGRKDCVSQPRDSPRGAFSESHPEQPRSGLHLYRRVAPRECFVASASNFSPRLTNVSRRDSTVGCALFCL